MTKSVLLAGLFHETHTFLAQETGIEQFRQGGLHIGQQVIDANLGNGSPTDGFLSYAAAQNWNVVPAIQMAAVPSGIVTDEALAFFKSHFFETLTAEHKNIDAIYLVLHGAMVAQSIDDVEGELLCEIHEFQIKHQIDIPVVAVIDLHANVSKTMTDFSTCLFSYRENPHNDARDAAVRAASLLDELIKKPTAKQLHLSTSFVVPPTGLATANNPMKSVLARAKEMEDSDPDLLCINVMGGYAYADIADCGFSLNCCTRGSEITAQNYLNELVEIFTNHLNAAYPLEASLEEVLLKIDNSPRGDGPILLIEPADNIGGGTPGDATGTLTPLLATGRTDIVAIINDPQAAALCHNNIIGDTIELTIGGKTDTHHGAPLSFRGTIKNLTDGKFELENKNSHLASMMGIHINMGPCAVIENEQAIILLTSRKTAPMDLGQLHSQGIKPEDAHYVIIKAAVSHKDAYDPIAAASYNIDSIGLCTSNLKTLPYQKLKHKQISLE